MASNVTACPSPTRGSCCWPQRIHTGSWTISRSEFMLLWLNKTVIRAGGLLQITKIFVFPHSEFKRDFLELLRRRFGEKRFLCCCLQSAACGDRFFHPQGQNECTTTLYTMSTSATGSTSIWMPQSGRLWPTSPSGWEEKVNRGSKIHVDTPTNCL